MSDPTGLSDAGKEQETHRRFQRIKAELSASGIRGLIGRMERGLDPMGMTVASETEATLDPLLKGAGVDKEKFGKLVEDLHFGGIWENAERLAAATEPEVRAWMLLAQETQEVNDRDLTQGEFLDDVDRIKAAFLEAAAHPGEALASATANMQQRAEKAFIIEDGVAISNQDAFIFMAMRGETAGVTIAGDLMFVGSDELDFETVAASQGLRKEVRKDPRRGDVDTTFYVGENGTEVKVLGKGFCIVFGGNKNLAKALARTGQKRSE